MLCNLFGTECRWLHILLSLLSILIDFVEKEILALSSAASMHITIVCSVLSDTWSTASTISCWSSWFPSYLRTTSRGACCRLSPGAQRSCWHKREGRNRNRSGDLSAVLQVISFVTWRSEAVWVWDESTNIMTSARLMKVFLVMMRNLCRLLKSPWKLQLVFSYVLTTRRSKKPSKHTLKCFVSMRQECVCVRERVGKREREGSCEFFRATFAFQILHLWLNLLQNGLCIPSCLLLLCRRTPPPPDSDVKMLWSFYSSVLLFSVGHSVSTFN